MKLQDYVRRYGQPQFDDSFLEIPARRDDLLKAIGRGKRVLDLGCWQFAKLIKDQNNDVCSVELNERAADQAIKRGILVKVHDLNEGIPFTDAEFDVVHAGRVLERVYDTKTLLEDCNRVLKPGGLLLFSVFNLNSLENRLRVLTGGYLTSTGAFPEDHGGQQIRVFNLPKARELCAYAGFRVVDVQGVPALSPHTLRYRVLNPLMRVLPELSELLIVKARRIDQ